MVKPKKTRKFGGRRFRWIGTADYKRNAQDHARKLRGQGHGARVVEGKFGGKRRPKGKGDKCYRIYKGPKKK